jgi:uncharacterized protein YndB with AHSA1/START domain
MKSKTNKPDYVYVTYINTTPQKLWAALTNPKLIPQFWLGRRVVSTWAKGAEVTAHDADGDLEWTGKVVESRPPHRLTYTFQMPGSKQPVTRVTYDIEEIEKDSMLYGKGLNQALHRHQLGLARHPERTEVIARNRSRHEEVNQTIKREKS